MGLVGNLGCSWGQFGNFGMGYWLLLFFVPWWNVISLGHGVERVALMSDDVAEYGALVDSLQRGEFQAAFDLIFSSHELWSRVLTMHPFLLIRKTEIKN